MHFKETRRIIEKRKELEIAQIFEQLQMQPADLENNDQLLSGFAFMCDGSIKPIQHPNLPQEKQDCPFKVARENKALLALKKAV